MKVIIVYCKKKRGWEYRRHNLDKDRVKYNWWAWLMSVAM